MTDTERGRTVFRSDLFLDFMALFLFRRALFLLVFRIFKITEDKALNGFLYAFASFVFVNFDFTVRAACIFFLEGQLVNSTQNNDETNVDDYHRVYKVQVEIFSK